MQTSIGCLLERGRSSPQPTAGGTEPLFLPSRIAQASSARTITYEGYLFTSRRQSVTRPESGISVEHASHCRGEMALLKSAGVLREIQSFRWKLLLRFGGLSQRLTNVG